MLIGDNSAALRNSLMDLKKPHWRIGFGVAPGNILAFIKQAMNF